MGGVADRALADPGVGLSEQPTVANNATVANHLPCPLRATFPRRGRPAGVVVPTGPAWLTGVTAAVVGVIANLAVFFALRVLFPESGGFDAFAAVLAVVSFLVLRRFAIQSYWLVPAGALAGMVWVLLGMR